MRREPSSQSAADIARAKSQQDPTPEPQPEPEQPAQEERTPEPQPEPEQPAQEETTTETNEEESNQITLINHQIMMMRIMTDNHLNNNIYSIKV